MDEGRGIYSVAMFQTRQLEKSLYCKGFRAVLFCPAHFSHELRNSKFTIFLEKQEGHRRDISIQAEGYTPIIAFAEATFEVKSKWV